MKNLIAEFLIAPFSYGIIAITLYASYIFFNLSKNNQRDLLLRPYAIFRGENLKSVFTSMLIHSNWQHFIFNMFSFYFFAPIIEQTVGSITFFWLYILAGISGALPLILKYKHNAHYSALGASGAVSGIVFAFITLYPFAPLQLFLIPFSFPAIIFGILYLVSSFYMSKRNSDNIAHEAHIGGAICGILFMVFFR